MLLTIGPVVSFTSAANECGQEAVSESPATLTVTLRWLEHVLKVSSRGSSAHDYRQTQAIHFSDAGIGTWKQSIGDAGHVVYDFDLSKLWTCAEPPAPSLFLPTQNVSENGGGHYPGLVLQFSSGLRAKFFTHDGPDSVVTTPEELKIYFSTEEKADAVRKAFVHAALLLQEQN